MEQIVSRSVELFVPKCDPLAGTVKSHGPLRIVLDVATLDEILRLYDAVCSLGGVKEIRACCYQVIQPLEFYDHEGRWSAREDTGPADRPRLLCVSNVGVYWVDRYDEWRTGPTSIDDIREATQRIKGSSVSISAVLDCFYST